MRVPGFARLYAGLLLGRVSGTVVTVALVLFVLTRYHSPQLAGATAFFAIFPGLLISPLAGALLDRKGRSRLVVLDYLVAAASVGLIAGLSALHSLSPVLLLTIVGFSSLTNPLSTAGARTLFPLLVPKELWERANGLDSSGHVLATLVGAPLAGTLVGLIGGEWALAAAGVLFVGAALVMVGLPDPAEATESHGNVLKNAWLGLKYVVQNPTLRGLAFTLSFLNFGWGVLDIAVPVLVLGRLQQGPATVGYLWGVLGAAGLISALLAGRVPTLGRERQIMLGGHGNAAIRHERGRRRDCAFRHGPGEWAFRYQLLHSAPAPNSTGVVRASLCGVDVSQLRGHSDRLGACRHASGALRRCGVVDRCGGDAGGWDLSDAHDPGD